MSFLISLVIALVVIGLVLYVVNLLPLEATIKKIINVVVIVFVVLWLLSALFGTGHFPTLNLN